MLLKEQYQVLVKSLLPYAQKELGFNKPPVINFLDDTDNSQNPLGKTGFYRPDDKSISIFITNRHPKDILRSVAHELVHYQQDCDGRLSQHMRKELHDKRYAQNNPDLRKFEEEAYLKGNMIFRDWEDNYKNQPKRIKIAMNESKIRQVIKQLVSEILSEEKKKKEEEQRADVSKVRDSAKKYLKSKKIMAEATDNKSVPLTEWKNQELFGLLSNKFIGRNLVEATHMTVPPQSLVKKVKPNEGDVDAAIDTLSTSKVPAEIEEAKKILVAAGMDPMEYMDEYPVSEAKEMSAKDKKLAAMYPPKDKITRGDVITAAKKKSKGSSEEEEEEELDEAKDLPKKVVKKGHEIAKSIKKEKGDVENPYAVGMAAAKKQAGIK